MAITLGSAISAYIEGLGLGIKAYTRLPDGTKEPYVVIHDAIANPRDRSSGSHAVGGRKGGVISEVQVDVWQKAMGTADAAGKRVREYDPNLPEVIAANLDGADLGNTTPGKIYGCSLVDGPRELPSPLATDLMHHVISLQIHRNLPLTHP